MSFFDTFLQFLTASNRFDSPYDAIVPDVKDNSDTNVTELRAAELGKEPHIGRP